MEKEQQIALIRAVQAGDAGAADTLFGAIYNDVYYFARKTVKDPDLACDVTQEALLDIFNHIGSLKDPAAFPAWSRQITYHQCTRHFRKTQDVLVDETEDGGTIFDTVREENAEFIPDEALDQEDFRKTILAFIDTLSAEQRSAVLLYDFDELSVAEIASIQGVSEGTVKSRLNYARKAIKAQVEEYEDKHGIKLHAVPFFPLIRFLITDDKLGKVLPAAVAQQTAAAVVAATTTAAATAAGTASSAVGGVSLLAKIAAVPLVTKLVAIGVALAVVAGSVAVGVGLLDSGKPRKGNSKDKEAAVEVEKPSATKPTKPNQPAVPQNVTVDGVTYQYMSYRAQAGAQGVEGWVAVDVADKASAELTIPAVIDGRPVVGINDGFGKKLPSLTALTVRCQTVSMGAFAAHPTLRSLVIGSEVELVADRTFTACEQLTNVTVESGNQVISCFAFDDSAFYNDEANWQDGLLIVDTVLLRTRMMQEVDVPEGVTYIAAGALQGYCSGAEVIRLPSTVTRGLDSFSDPFVREVHVSPDNPVYHDYDNCIIETADKKLVFGTVNSTIPNDGSVTVIGKFAFGRMTSSEDFRVTVTLPDGLLTVEEYAFAGKHFTIAALPSSLQTVGDGAFEGCRFDTFALPHGIRSIGQSAFAETEIGGDLVIPQSLTSIGTWAFGGADFDSVTVQEGNPVYRSEGNCLLEDTTVLLGCRNSVLPDTVTAIGDRAFSHTAITAVTFPPSLRRIESRAFESTALQRVTVPRTVTFVGGGAFAECPELTELVLQGPTSVSYPAVDCPKLTHVTFGAAVQEIDYGSFSGSPLETVVFEEIEGWYLFGERMHVDRETENVIAYLTVDDEETYAGRETNGLRREE